MSNIVEDFESCYRLSDSRDPRYDGIFFIAATSTRLYCRPSCPARQPKRANVSLLPNGGGRAVGRLPRLQALPPRCGARLTRLELAR
jgi:AraC family transcriptional regulator, regulatory protein of adaptative response / methylated-DNA-[protein]-cysteine methyltransferase